MSFGLRIWNGSGQIRLDISDRFTRLVQTGSAYIASEFGSVFVPVTGMTASDDWAICVTSHMGCFAVPSLDGFYIYEEDMYPQTVYYSIYRR